MQMIDLDVHHIHIGDEAIRLHNNMTCDDPFDVRIVFFSNDGQTNFEKIVADARKAAV